MPHKLAKGALFFLLTSFIFSLSFLPEPILTCYQYVTFVSLGIGMLLSLYLNHFHLKRHFFERRDYPLWMYLILVSVTIFFAQDKTASLFFYRRLTMAAILIYFVFKNEYSLRRIEKLLFILVTCAGLVCVFGFIEMVTASNIIYSRYLKTFCYQRFIGNRMMSTLVHPNVLGAYLIVCLPLAYHFYRKEVVPFIRAFKFMLLAFILTGTILTFSRGTWCALFLMFLAWCLIKKRFRQLVFIVGIAGIILFIASLPVVKYSILGRFNVEGLWQYIQSGHRIEQYRVTARILAQHPLTGIGLNHYREVFDNYTRRVFPYEVKIPDSIYLMHLAETGLIGFFGLAFFLGSLFIRAFFSYARLEKKKKEIFFALAMGFIGLLFAMAFFDGFLWKTPLYLLFLCAGIISVLNGKPQD
ncbi:MAG: O-antigen ligase family protein [Candidatus Omnitrophica bacterium]|nr:O-antigen ligase family protein [Candidatus Omnitrophota bacterium]